MTSIKIKFKPSTLKDHEGTIFYQIIHERKVKQIFTAYHLFRDEWDEVDDIVRILPGYSNGRTILLQSIKERIKWDMELLRRIVADLEMSCPSFSVDDIADGFAKYRQECSLFNFMEGIIARLRQNGKVRTSENYRATLNSFKKFRDQRDTLLEEISQKLICDYECWLNSCGITSNTLSFYMRILRATYNRAVDDGLIIDRRPFRHVYTGVDRTIKRALPLTVIRKIKSLDLSLVPYLDYARDLFLLSFMLRGMSVVDMAFLKKSDLQNGCVCYKRRKTGRMLTIEWTPEMQAVLDKYPTNPTEYLLPIVTSCDVDAETCYRNVSARINYGLKKIAAMIGIKIPLTLYVARHSWASAAKAKGIPMRVISEGMGHDSETTTQIYLASLDNSVINRANKLILSSI